MIEILNLKKTYGKRVILPDVSIKFQPGYVYAIMGPNGSGKTTILKSLLGLVLPEYGIIKVNSIDIKKDFKYRECIGYMPQIAKYPENLKVYEIFNLIKELRNVNEDVDNELYIKFNIEKFKNEQMGNLSGGQKQKIGACLAFMFNQSILILDEPTAGLDPISTEILKEKIRKEKASGKLIIITSHIASEVEEISDKIIFLLDGKVFVNEFLEKFKTQQQEINLSKALAKLMVSNNES